MDKDMNTDMDMDTRGEMRMRSSNKIYSLQRALRMVGMARSIIACTALALGWRRSRSRSRRRARGDGRSAFIQP